MLKINLEYKKSMLFIRLKGNLNKNTAPRFKEYTLPIIKDYKIKYIVYNLNGLVELDSYGEESLKESSKVIKNNNGKVLVVNNNIKTNLKFPSISKEMVALELIN